MKYASHMTERDIQRDMVELLASIVPFLWLDRQSAGKPRNRMGNIALQIGVPDIHGIIKTPCACGKMRPTPLAVEVKIPGCDGVLSRAQFEWLTKFRFAGGVGFVARSIEELQRKLALARVGQVTSIDGGQDACSK